jgi:hypothetical protein
MMENVGAEPVQECFFIGATELPYLSYLPNLCPMRFDGSPFPGVLGKESGIDADLGSEKPYHLGGRFLSGTQETTFILEALE